MSQEQLSFGWAEPDAQAEALPAWRAVQLRDRLANLSKRQVFLGTSSWKYPGWVRQLYNPNRYQTGGKFSKAKFTEECLSEYAEVFPTVCGDFAFYQFPTEEAWKHTFRQVPQGFYFALKIPEEITVERFPNLPRYGKRAGMENAHFLDSSLLRDRLLGPLEQYREKLGPLIFQFGTFHHGPMRETKSFAERLDRTLSVLPVDRFQFSVEVRNPEFLSGNSDYLACLRNHGVAHCFNSWTKMPSVSEQMHVPGIFTSNYTVARFLLKPGRTYNEAVEQFSPYEQIRDPYPEGRDSLRELIESQMGAKKPLFAFVNNRFEGNALETIERVLNDSNRFANS